SSWRRASWAFSFSGASSSRHGLISSRPPWWRWGPCSRPLDTRLELLDANTGGIRAHRRPFSCSRLDSGLLHPVVSLSVGTRRYRISRDHRLRRNRGGGLSSAARARPCGMPKHAVDDAVVADCVGTAAAPLGRSAWPQHLSSSASQTRRN